MPSLEGLLSRADDQTIQELLGRGSLRLIQLLNRQDDMVTRLKDVLIELYTLEGLLILPDKRALLLDLLRSNEAEELCVSLNVPYNVDPYESLKSLNIRRGSHRESALFNYFNLSPPPIEERQELPHKEKISGSYELFKHQRLASQQIIEKLSCDPRRVLLHMPTGAGKTRTTMHIIVRHLIARENTVVVWLAYSEELCEQAMGEFLKAWQSLGNRKLSAYRFWGNYDVDTDDIKDGLLVAGLSKTFSTIQQGRNFIGRLASKCTLIIIDEAHQAIAETYKLVLDALFHYNQDTGLLGLTATPGRTSWNITSDEELSDYFNRQKVTLDIEGYASPIEYLVKEKYIAKTNYRTLDYEGLDNFDVASIGRQFEIPWDILTRLAEDEVRNLKILSCIEDLTKRHRRILVFAINVKHAEMFAAVLRARSFFARSITANTPRETRRLTIDEFKEESNKIRILTNYGVLTTGFDAPKTSAAVIARPTKSLVLFSQMVGRVTRGVKAGGNEEAEVVTVVDMGLPGFGSMVEAFNNWEDVWK